MSDKLYDQVIGRLKKSMPAPSNPEDLTDSILSEIDKSGGQEHKFLFAVSDKHWQIIRSLRIISTAAAVVLICFFTLEQKATNEKIRLLEQQVARQPGNPQDVFSQVSYSTASGILKNTDSLKNMLIINRSSLNFMLERIRDLESENKSLKDKFLEMYDVQEPIKK